MKQVRCKRCGEGIDSKDYAEHLVTRHNDYSRSKLVPMPTATICVRCKKNKITNFINGTCKECDLKWQD